MAVRPEVVRSKPLDISEALGRLRSWLPLDDFEAFVADVEGWLSHRPG